MARTWLFLAIDRGLSARLVLAARRRGGHSLLRVQGGRRHWRNTGMPSTAMQGER